MGTPLGPKYIPYTYMDPLGLCSLRYSLMFTGFGLGRTYRAGLDG